MLRRIIQKSCNQFGYKIIPFDKDDTTTPSFPPDMDSDFQEVYLKCREYTMTSIERMYALYKSVKYVVYAGISGDFVECGVWKGGSAMCIAATLLKLGDTSRKIYLYDTFEGMPKPTEEDRTIYRNLSAIKIWEREQKRSKNKWCRSTITEVKNNLLLIGYPEKQIVFVKGLVEDTIPKTIPPPSISS